MPRPFRGGHIPDDSAAIAEVVHELRAPLGGVEAMARLLRESNLTPQQRRIVDGLCAAAEHLRSVANDVLDGTALSGGQLRFDEKPVLLHDFMVPVAVAANARATAAGLAFSMAIDRCLTAAVMADSRRIRQMLENLLDNAFKVTKSGEVRLVVRHVDRRGRFEGVRFEISDTGPGVAEMDGAKLFQKYAVLDNGIAGTGLGLAVVRKLATAMGGEAGCHGKVGEGSTFWFTLRLKLSDFAVERAICSSCHHVGNGEQNRPGQRVLVVDDNQANRMIMAAVLEHFGFQMVEAESAEQALELLPIGPFVAVMMDQTLPGMSGLDALKRIREMPAPLGTVPVIPVTGRVSANDREAFAAAGACGFVEKPITARAVMAALAAALPASGEIVA